MEIENIQIEYFEKNLIKELLKKKVGRVGKPEGITQTSGLIRASCHPYAEGTESRV